MATDLNDPTLNNGQPLAATAPSGPAPVVQFHRPSDFEAPGTRAWKKQLPAWAISGGVHLTLAVVFLFGMSSRAVPVVSENQVLETKVEDAAVPKQNFENTDTGFNEPEKQYNLPLDRIENVTLPGIVRPDEPVGIEGAASGPPQNVPPPVGFGETGTGKGVDSNVPGVGAMTGDEGGFARAMRNVPGAAFAGRSGATRQKVAMAEGGNGPSEAAVARGLQWLMKQQKTDGRWQLDGTGMHNDDIAATGMALLPFLAAGQTHKPPKGEKEGPYTKTVENGLKYLLGKQKANGDFSGRRDMYGVALGTMALCEAYGMTGDPTLKRAAQLGLDFIVKGQHAAGGWRYDPGQVGDTSVTGWCLQALKSGYLAGLDVRRDAMAKVNNFLDTMAVRNGSEYGYTSTQDIRPNMSAVALLCRQYLGWGPKNPQLIGGVEYLKKSPPNKNGDIYFYYYATQVMHFYGGPDWENFWNPKMRDLLISQQDVASGPNNGSFPANHPGYTAKAGGRITVTCLSLLTLEVYYRHLPLYKRDGSGLKELEI